ncbi:hypothetical protein BZL29_1836 [Mycobacterium kansasii]|uniref:DUF222 domain-containing protein n=1 Tax=Mycobacterium kansasii TaxID=1768 RepID=A0A1V3XP47_MYCKA|nr:hypothetical protein BZL29_1836 [Mycobacterium kansasii]
MDWLNPDGECRDQERARKRGIMLGRQEFDGMSRISGMLTPELRAAVEAVLAKLAAPGRATPMTKPPSWMRRPMRMRCAVTRAVRRNATTTASLPDCGGCWRRGSWANTTGYRCRSW